MAHVFPPDPASEAGDASVAPRPPARSVGGSGSWFFLIAGLFACAVSLPGVLAIPAELEDDNPAILVVLIFPLLGLGMLAAFVRSVLDRLRFGEVVVQLEAEPAPLGGELVGEALVPRGLPPDAVPRITLTCQESVTRRSGDDTTTDTRVLWSRTGPADVARTAGGTRLGFAFALPAEGAPTDAEGGRRVTWVLEMSASLPGVDLVRRLDAEVVRPPVPATRRVPPGGYTHDRAIDTPLDPRVLQVVVRDGVETLHAPARRRRGAAVALVLFGALFTAIGLAIGLVAEPGTFVGWLFLAIFGGVGLLVVGAGLYSLGHAVWLTVDAHGVHRVDRWFGLRVGGRTLPLSEVATLRLAVGGTETRGQATQAHWHLDARRPDGRTETLLDGLPDTAQAQAVAVRVRLMLAVQGCAVEVEEG
ncbi:MAG: hypothetical protein H6732_12055 [Alphaproteobacteria bacterium]|nr:hypothetical protein [Alphaproteobacteria bacterium]